MTLLRHVRDLDQVYANLRTGYEDITRIQAVINGNQCPTSARSSDTFTGFNYKECAVVGALDHGAAAIKELIVDPFERNTYMRTAVLVEINFTLLFDTKQLAPCQDKSLAATFWDVSKAAQTQFIR